MAGEAMDFGQYPLLENLTSSPNASLVRHIHADLSPTGIAMLIVYGILLAAGLAGNLWVARYIGLILFFNRSAASSVPRSFQCYIFALCISDILLLSSLFFLLTELICGKWIFGNILCQLYCVIDGMAKFTAPFILAAVSATCYLSVCRLDCLPYVHDPRIALITILASFALVFLLLIPIYMYSGVYDHIVHEDPTQILVIAKCGFHPPSNTIAIAWNAYTFTIGYLIPVLCFLYCYLSLLFFIHRHVQSVQQTAFSFCRVVKIILALISAFLLSWTPYWILMWMLLLLAHEQELPESVVLLMYLCHLLPYVSCTVYPILYTVCNRGFQETHDRIREDRSQVRVSVPDIQRRSSAAMTRSLELAEASFSHVSSGNPVSVASSRTYGTTETK